MRRLLGIQGVYTNRYFDLEKDEITIGRDESCDIRLDADADIASVQAKMTSGKNGYELSDLDRKCPSTVNGQTLGGSARLRHGDLLQIGDTVFRYEDAESKQQNAAGASPSPANKTVSSSQPLSAKSQVTVIDKTLAEKPADAIQIVEPTEEQMTPAVGNTDRKPKKMRRGSSKAVVYGLLFGLLAVGAGLTVMGLSQDEDSLEFGERLAGYGTLSFCLILFLWRLAVAST